MTTATTTRTRARKRKPLPDLVGTSEVAEHCDVERRTVNMWLYRAEKAREQGRDEEAWMLPAPEARCSGTPVWQRSTIVDWWTRRNAGAAGTD